MSNYIESALHQGINRIKSFLKVNLNRVMEYLYQRPPTSSSGAIGSLSALSTYIFKIKFMMHFLLQHLSKYNQIVEETQTYTF